MDSKYNFDAPQFIDLGSEIQDTYFELKEKEILTGTEGRRVTFVSPDEKENTCNIDGNKTINNINHQNTKKNQECKINDDDSLSKEIGKLMIDSTRKTPSRAPLRNTQVFEGIPLLPGSEKKHRMSTRADAVLRTPILHLRNRSIPRQVESDDETDESMLSAISSSSDMMSTIGPDKGSLNLKRTSDHLAIQGIICQQHPSKFIAMAEQVANFHRDTPDRYKSRPNQVWKPSAMKKPTLATAKSPNLACAKRSRAVNYPNREEREMKEYEEMLKNQVKAHPVKEKILKQVSMGLKAPIEKRPTTCPVPFKLTEYTKPKPKEETAVFTFKAQPVPTKILQSPVGIPAKKIIPATTPKTPAITLPTRVRVGPTPQPLKFREFAPQNSTESLRTTTIRPFSFDQRDRILHAQKEQKIQKVLEEEKKIFSSFKAQPIKCSSSKANTPLKAYEIKKTVPMPFNLTKPKPVVQVTEPEIKPPLFKAKPAAVLNKRPYFPRHQPFKSPQPVPFNFKTDTRVAERKKFDEELREMEEMRQRLQEKRREEEEQQLQEEAKKMRKLAEFKAHPVPKPKPFKLQTCQQPLTQPISPCFRSGKAKRREEEEVKEE